jgi:hypothetical protein
VKTESHITVLPEDQIIHYLNEHSCGQLRLFYHYGDWEKGTNSETKIEAVNQVDKQILADRLQNHVGMTDLSNQCDGLSSEIKRTEKTTRIHLGVLRLGASMCNLERILKGQTAEGQSKQKSDMNRTRPLNSCS